jgi:hypothetical protein
VPILAVFRRMAKTKNPLDASAKEGPQYGHLG